MLGVCVPGETPGGAATGEGVPTAFVLLSKAAVVSNTQTPDVERVTFKQQGTQRVPVLYPTALTLPLLLRMREVPFSLLIHHITGQRCILITLNPHIYCYCFIASVAKIFRVFKILSPKIIL